MLQHKECYPMSLWWKGCSLVNDFKDSIWNIIIDYTSSIFYFPVASCLYFFSKKKGYSAVSVLDRQVFVLLLSTQRLIQRSHLHTVFECRSPATRALLGRRHHDKFLWVNAVAVRHNSSQVGRHTGYVVTTVRSMPFFNLFHTLKLIWLILFFWASSLTGVNW